MFYFGTGGAPLVLVGLAILGSLVFFGPAAPIVLVILLPPLLMAGLALSLSRRRARPVELATYTPPLAYTPPMEFEDVRRVAQDDLLALADDIRELDLEVELPDADPAGKRDYAVALDRYERAARAFDRARTPEDLEAVSAALEEGRFAMTSAKARLEGRPPPERRPPCFFDPRHGPSVRDVEWAPAEGTPRLVPACAADAIRIEEGREPLAREVVVHGERRPYWEAPESYGPWAGGYFGGFAGGLLPALFFGSMLGGGFALGGPLVLDEGYDGDFGDFGGDVGGGDFGDE